MQQKCILVATDLTGSSRLVLGYGAFVAARLGMSMTALHVLEQLWTSFATVYGVEVNDQTVRSDLWEQAQTNVTRQIADSVPSTVSATARVRGGRAYDEIVEEAKESSAELIVVGTHGRTGLTHAALGSVAQQVVRQATCPVLTVHTGVETPHRVRRILFTTDMSDGSFEALEVAMRFARAFGAEIDVLFVIPEFAHYTPVMQHYLESTVAVGYLESATERVGERLEEALGARSAADVCLNPMVQHGPIVKTILDTAAHGSHDLIVATTHGRRGLPHFVLGSVVEKVVRRASCPVLTLRAVAHHSTHG